MTSLGGPVSIRSAVVTLAILTVAAPAAAQRVRQISEFLVTSVESYAVDDAGDLAFFTSDVNPLGTNPNHLSQVFKMPLPGGAAVQVTALDADVTSISVSDDGGTILFISAADPLGSNADRGRELFLADASGGSMVQLTDHPFQSGEVRAAVLSGDASTALFLSDGDPTGGNPSGYLQLFVTDTGATSVVQLTPASTEGETPDFAISDDGSRIAFIDNRDLTGANADGSYELFRVLSNGTDLSQVTIDTNVESLDLAGVGSPIVYADEHDDLYTLSWGATTPTLRDTESEAPSISDNGWKTYYLHRPEVGTRSIRLFDVKAGPPVDIRTGEGWEPVVCGAGTRLLFRDWGDNAPSPLDPHARVLLAMNGDGSSPELVVDAGPYNWVGDFEMSADGRWIVFLESDSPGALHRADTESLEITDLSQEAWTNASISDDGSTVAFNTAWDVTPEVCPGADSGVYRIVADDWSLLEVAPDPATCYNTDLPTHPAISGDGSVIVFQCADDPSGLDNGIGVELYVVDSAGGPITPVTNDDAGSYKHPRVDDTGTWVAYHSSSNITGQNPDNLWQVFRIRSDGTGLEQLTTDSGIAPDLSGDGTKIVYYSDGDPLGTNPEGNYEIFLFDSATSTTEQLTVTASGDNRRPRISANGAYVAFASDSPRVSAVPFSGVYRLELATGEVRLASAGEAYSNLYAYSNGVIGVSDAGAVSFRGEEDLVRRNPDNSLELWLAEFDAVPMFEPGVEDPTPLRWDPLPWALSYDVIRGNVANLSAGMGGTVDLGAVVCIEEDSADATTLGFEDPLQPGPGEVLYYLYRGWGGDLVGDDSWGEGTGGAARVPSGGSCADGS